MNAFSLGDQTGDWEQHPTAGAVGGFYYAEGLAGPRGMHFHLWIGDYSPESREVRRALKELSLTQDMVSYSYSKFSAPNGEHGKALPLLTVPKTLSERIVRSKASSVSKFLGSLGEENLWADAERGRLQDLLGHVGPINGQNYDAVLLAALKVTSACMQSNANAIESAVDYDQGVKGDQVSAIRQAVSDLDGWLPVDAPAALRSPGDLTDAQKVHFILAATDGGERLERDSDKRLLFDAVDAGNPQPLYFTAPRAESLNRLFELAASGHFDPPKPSWLCGVEHVTQDSGGFVHWKGKHIEHFSHRLPDEAQELEEATRSLALICDYLERTGQEVSAGSYLRTFDDLRRSPMTRYFVVAPRPNKAYGDTRFCDDEAITFEYQTDEELEQKLRKRYISDFDWSACPIFPADDIRSMYASDAAWERAKQLDPYEADQRAEIEQACNCKSVVAEAIIRAAKTGRPQNVNGGTSYRLDWILSTFVTPEHVCEHVSTVEDAKSCIERHIWDNNSSAWQERRYPNIAAAAQKALAGGKLLTAEEALKSYIDKKLEEHAAQNLAPAVTVVPKASTAATLGL